MTIIAWDGNSLSSDKMVTIGYSTFSTTKIKKINNKLCGTSGDAVLTHLFFDWVNNGCDSKNWPEEIEKSDFFSGLIIERDNDHKNIIKKYEKSCGFPIIIENKFFAIGSGVDFAIAAMHLGKTSRQSVEVANILCQSCGNGIDEIFF